MKLCPAAGNAVARFSCLLMSCLLLSVCVTSLAVAQKKPDAAKVAANLPWMNASLDPDTRADMMVKEMTLDEKIQLVHGAGWGVLRPGAAGG
jgi:beta-glucosidase